MPRREQEAGFCGAAAVSGTMPRREQEAGFCGAAAVSGTIWHREQEARLRHVTIWKEIRAAVYLGKRTRRKNNE